jgi:hypothetical protein
MKCVVALSICFHHCPTGHSVPFEMKLPLVQQDAVTSAPVKVLKFNIVDIPVMQMKVEFKIEGKKRHELLKGKVKIEKAIPLYVSEVVDDKDSSQEFFQNLRCIGN